MLKVITNSFEVECKQIDSTSMQVLLTLNLVSCSWVRSQLGLEEEVSEKEPCNAEKFILSIED